MNSIWLINCHEEVELAFQAGCQAQRLLVATSRHALLHIETSPLCARGREVVVEASRERPVA